MNKISRIFGKNKNIIIGVIHFPPLLSYPDFPGFKVAFKNALADLRAFEQGGVDGIIFENNYDIPHKPFVEPPVISAMTFLGEKMRRATKLPLGVNVLWNDYRTSLSSAKVLNLQFIRIPVFVDKVKADCGIIEGDPKDILNFRKLIKAENVALFTDIHVKHSKLLSKHSLIQSAKLAMKYRSDAVIITGKWTGQSPDLDKLESLRNSIGHFPILVGSGADKTNIKSLLKYTNGAIVSTSLKKGSALKKEVNVKKYNQRINIGKVKELVKVIKQKWRKF